MIYTISLRSMYFKIPFYIVLIACVSLTSCHEERSYESEAFLNHTMLEIDSLIDLHENHQELTKKAAREYKKSILGNEKRLIEAFRSDLRFWIDLSNRQDMLLDSLEKVIMDPNLDHEYTYFPLRTEIMNCIAPHKIDNYSPITFSPNAFQYNNLKSKFPTSFLYKDFEQMKSKAQELHQEAKPIVNSSVYIQNALSVHVQMFNYYHGPLYEKLFKIRYIPIGSSANIENLKENLRYGRITYEHMKELFEIPEIKSNGIVRLDSCALLILQHHRQKRSENGNLQLKHVDQLDQIIKEWERDLNHRNELLDFDIITEHI